MPVHFDHPGGFLTGERYSRDPRYVAQKAQEHLFSTGVDN